MTAGIGFSPLGAAFFLLGIYGRAWLLLPGVALPGAGRIGVRLG